MTLLFFSAVCDFCEGKIQGRFHHGYVVYRGASDGQIHEEYVFRTREDAEKWRAVMNQEVHEIREVYCEQPFHWRKSSGSISDLELADHLYAIYPDHRYEPSSSNAHVA